MADKSSKISFLGGYLRECGIKQIKNLASKYCSENAKVLDIGCGKGFVLNALDQFKKENKIGIDIYDLPKRSYKDGYRQDFIFLKTDLRKMDFPPESFDLIICTHVIEHITLEEGKELIKRVKGLLKKGGIFILTTPNTRSLTRLTKKLFRKLHLYNFLKGLTSKKPAYLSDIKYKKFDRQHPKYLKHEHEYSPDELKSIIEEESLTTLERGGGNLSWYSFNRIINGLLKIFPKKLIKLNLMIVDKSLDIFHLWRLAGSQFIVAKK